MMEELLLLSTPASPDWHLQQSFWFDSKHQREKRQDVKERMRSQRSSFHKF